MSRYAGDCGDGDACAATTADTSQHLDLVSMSLLRIWALVNCKLAVATLDRDNAAKERLSAAYLKLHEFTSRNVEDPVAGAQAAAGAYDEVRAALRGCPKEVEELMRDAASPLRDAVVLSCLSLCGHRERDAFAAALEDAFGRQLNDESLESQLHLSYRNLMMSVPGAFTSRSKMRTRRAR